MPKEKTIFFACGLCAVLGVPFPLVRLSFFFGGAFVVSRFASSSVSVRVSGQVLRLLPLLRLAGGRGGLLLFLVVCPSVRRVGGSSSLPSLLRVVRFVACLLGVAVRGCRWRSCFLVVASAQRRPSVSRRRVSVLVVCRPFSIGTSSGGCGLVPCLPSPFMEVSCGFWFAFSVVSEWFVVGRVWFSAASSPSCACPCFARVGCASP